MTALLLAAIAAAGPLGADPAQLERLGSVEVVGTSFRVHLANGRTLAGEELVGAILSVVVPGGASPQRVRIEEIVTDPRDPLHETLLYRMSALDPDTGAATELCEPDAQGERWAFPVTGQWDGEGRFISGHGFTLTCAGGAQGKCVRFGYKPWRQLPDGRSLAPFHQACVHMVRANYCGDLGTTRDGMPIDVYDRAGILAPDASSESRAMRFEAAWTPDGAVCVAHTRVPQELSLEQLGTGCARLSGRLGDARCSEALARATEPDALIFNRSLRSAPAGP
jgi:hypothetical protein